MRRFFKLMSITMQQRMYYRAGFLLNLTTPLILLAGQFLLWSSIYSLRGGEALGQYAWPDMKTYLLLAFGINNLFTWSSENTLSREIRSGAVTIRRIRPVSFLTQSIAEMCGNMALQGTVNAAAVAVVFLAAGDGVTRPSMQALPSFALSLALAMVLRMLMVNMFSLLCFFTTGHLGLSWTRTALMEFFSGALIPVALFPTWLRTLSYALPFPMMLQVPVSILLGEPLALPLSVMYAMSCAWIAAFYVGYRLLFRQVRRNVSLAGG